MLTNLSIFYRGGNINFNVSLCYDTGFVFITLTYCLSTPQSICIFNLL